MTREKQRAAVAVFSVLFAETLLICIWIVGEQSDGLHPEGRPAIFVLCLLVPLICAGLITYHFARRKHHQPLFEDSTVTGDPRTCIDLTPHLTALDYCLTIPLFLLAYLGTRMVIVAVLKFLFGIPREQVPMELEVLVPCVLAASLVVSHLRRRVLVRHAELLRQRNRARERRLAQQVTRNAALAQMRCPVCGYSIAGLPQRRCPECGETWSRTEEDAASGPQPEPHA